MCSLASSAKRMDGSAALRANVMNSSVRHFEMPPRLRQQRTDGLTGAGVNPPRRHFGERFEHEEPLAEARMRHLQPRLVDHFTAVEDQIEVERSRGLRRHTVAL